MTRQASAVLRLVASRARLRGVLAEDAAVGTLGALVLRLVRRHPLGSAALAALLGGLLMRARPWHWALKPELWSALLPALMATLANAPLSTWSGLLASFLHQASQSDSEPAPG
jgi:hypothetical protein